MKDISCEIIRDLILLCVDHMASQESESLVKDHLKTCEGCRNYYDALKTELETMPTLPSREQDARELKQFKHFLSVKKWQTVLAAMAGLLLLLVGTITYMNHKVRYIDYDEARLSVITEDQDMVLFTDSIKGNYRWAYDFDVNIEPNDPEENYPASSIRRFIFEAIQKHMGKYGYTKIENSTSVITIKAVDRNNRRIEHSCDFAIIHHYNNGKQKYIRYNKNSCSFSWEKRGNEYYIGDKLQWIKDNHLKEELRERYLIYKNRNNDPEKHSRTILAETVNNLYNEYTYRRR